MSEPRDQELEDYLAGKSEISRLYRQAPADEPPPELDAKIKSAARRELATRRPRWIVPLSMAAVLMLSIGVLLRMQQEGVAPVPAEKAATQAPAATFQVPTESAPVASEPASGDTARSAPRAEAPGVEMRSRESKAAVAEPFPAPVMVPEPAQGKAQSQGADEMPRSLRRDESETLMSPTVPADDAARAERSAQVREPGDWIEHIRRLRAEGHDAGAAMELKAFREHYPDYELPEDLRTDGN